MCSVEGCESPVYNKARMLCQLHYGRAYRAGELQLAYKPVHRISDVNLEAKTGVCAECGPVKVRDRLLSSGRMRFECWTQRKRGRRSPGARKRYKQKNGHRHGACCGARYRLKRKYGLTPEDVAAMRTEQGGRCAICQEEVDQLVVDHCHTTGRVRGLLCSSCNVGIGHLRDSVPRLQTAIAYLLAGAACVGQ